MAVLYAENSYFKLIKVIFSLFHYFLPVSLRVPLLYLYNKFSEILFDH